MAFMTRCLKCFYQDSCDYISCRIDEAKEIKTKTRKEFADRLKEVFKGVYTEKGLYEINGKHILSMPLELLVDEVLAEMESEDVIN